MTEHAKRMLVVSAVLLAIAWDAAARSWAAEPDVGPRDLLRQAGIDDSQFARLVDRKPWTPDEDELLEKVMFRLGSFPLGDVERWARRQIDFKLLAKSPEAERGQFFHLRGRVASIEVIRPPAEVARRFELEAYYRAEFVIDDRPDQQPAIVFTRVVPKAWRNGGKIDQPAGAWAMFLKLAHDAPDRPEPVFAAARIAWHPATLLGKLGMDTGLLDELGDRRAIVGSERECFYQMLAAVGRARPGELLAAADAGLRATGKDRYSVEPLFNDPAAERGSLVALSGTVRRAVRVRVEDPDIVKRFGIDHYYELYLFTDDSQGNPLVFCVRDLPEDMPSGDGPRYGESVRVAGFFLKSWSYRPGAGPEGERPEHARQLAPLLVGREPVWYPPPGTSSTTLVGAVAGAAFLLVLLGVWLVAWRYGRGDRRFRRRIRERHDPGEGVVSLEELNNGESSP
ncbi:MAG: hypothetical protein NTW96_13045 [Planctomycetia bacterium]|nr:hypothetical protein [Planctomycetia bacterium]